MFNKALLSGIPGWVLNGASLDLDFANGRAFSRGGGNAITGLLTTTRASTGYAATSSGLLVPFLSNIPRITDLGLLVEQAATNLALWNRDLTNANWTKSNITPALDQTGMDGAANAASSLTATSTNGTATAAAITSASASRTVTMGVKRITGSGAVSISQDGGSTFTAITTKVGASWYIPTPTDFAGLTQTVTNPQIVIKLGTSGDKIAVDFVDLEVGALNTSPIATTTVAVTRAADSIAVSNPAAILTASGTIVIKYNLQGINPNQGEAWAMSDTGNNRLALRTGGGNTTPSFLVGSGSGVGSASGSSTGTGVDVKIASTWGPASAALSQNGAAAVSVGNGWSGTSAGTFWIGRSENATVQPDGFIKRFTSFQTQASNAQLQALST